MSISLISLKEGMLKKTTMIGLMSCVVVCGVIVYKMRGQTEPVRYVLGSVSRGSVIVTVTGSGQVSSKNQVDIKPTVSGRIIKLNAKSGALVKAGDSLCEIDAKDQYKVVRDAAQNVESARVSLQSSQLALHKLKAPPESSALMQAEHAVNEANRAWQTLLDGADVYELEQAENDVKTQQENVRLSEDGKTPRSVRDVYDDAVPVMKGLAQALEQVVKDGDSVVGIDKPIANDAFESAIANSSGFSRAVMLYYPFRDAVQKAKVHIDALSVLSAPTEDIDAGIEKLKEALEAGTPFLQQTHEVLLTMPPSPLFNQSAIDGLSSTIQNDRLMISSKLTTVLTERQSFAQAWTAYGVAQTVARKAEIALTKLKNGPDAAQIATAKERLAEAQAALKKIQMGADPIDIAVAENAVSERRVALMSAQAKLADASSALKEYTVRAPFDGIVGSVAVTSYDQVTQGTAVATLLTEAKIAEITLNEIDATKVRIGQKVTLMFDALPDVTMAGVVSDVDSVGTVTQGVVNYGIKILFQTQDERIKAGMSVSASIVTEAKMDVLTLPNAAIHTINGVSTVQVLSHVATSSALSVEQGIVSDSAPESRVIEVGLSNNNVTEILSGITEQDQVVLRTIDPVVAAASAAKAASNVGSGIRIPGVSGGGFNGVLRTGGR